MGSLEEANGKAAESLELADQLAHPPSKVYALFWVGWIAHTLGHHPDACRLLEATMTMSRAHGLPQFLEWARVVRGSALTCMDRMSEGISEIRKSLDHLDGMRARLERPYCLTLLAAALLRDGSAEDAFALCDEALAIGHRTGAGCYEPETHRVRGEALLALGRPPAEAQSEFNIALSLARKDECQLLELRAALSWLRLRDSPESRKRLSDVVGSFAGSVDFPVLAEARTV
jgi:tetratricopeptide (TPR) repeat protein